MGTRADFYIGTGAGAEWLGSVAGDGYEWGEARPNKGTLMGAKTEEEFRAAVDFISKSRDDWTSPEKGWPWPWKNSSITDCVYVFAGHKAVYLTGDDTDLDWPDMTDRKEITFGDRSGLIILSAKEGRS